MRRSEPARNVGFRVKLAMSILILAVLIGAFVVWLPKEPKVPLIALAVTYSNQPQLPARPPNSWTAEDFDRFKTLETAQSGTSWFRRASLGEVTFERLGDDWGTGRSHSPEAALDVLEKSLRDVPPGGPDGNVILIYISAHGVVNRANEPCLLLEDSDPLKEETWLPVKTLCEKVCEAQRGAKIKKVLVLDCNRIDFNGSCGVLYNSFADQLEVLVKEGLDKEKCQGLVVLNSTSSGQIGWAAPELGGSVFGFYFFQALSGGANQGSNLSLKELTSFLEDAVDRWVLEHRQGHQTPIALFVDNKPDDFEVAKCNSNGPTDEQLEVWRMEARKNWDDDGAWNAVGDLWDEHDKLKSKKLYSLDPLRWAKLERGLLRLEQLLLAGNAYEDERTNLSKDLTALVKAAQEQPQEVPACSLTLDRRFSPELDTQEASSESDKTDDAAQSDAAAGSRYYLKAHKAWTRLTKKGSVSSQDMHDELAELAKIKQQPKTGAGLVEVHFLRMLARYVDESSGDVDPLTALAIKSRDSAERAAAPDDYRAHYWVTHWVNEADNLRRTAEDLLLVGPSSTDKDRTAFEEYENEQWNVAKAGYEKARTAAQEISKAFELRDRGWAQAPYLAQWLWAERIAEHDNEANSNEKTQQLAPEAAEHWGQLREVIRDLREISSAVDDELAKTADGTFDANAWKKRTDQLEQGLERLTGAFEAKSRELLSEGATQIAFARIGRHLDLPLVKASSRKDLRKIYLEFLGKKPEAYTRARRGKEPSAAKDNLGEIANHPFLELLATNDEGKPAQDVAEKEQPRPNWNEYRRRLTEQGGDVRKLLAKRDGEVQESLKEFHRQLKLLDDEPKSAQDRKRIARIRGGLSQADRLVRAAAALWDVKDNTDPTGLLHEFDLHQYLLWQCNRTLDDFWGPAEPKGEGYFAVAGGEFLGAAEKLFPAGTVLRAHTNDLLKRRKDAARELPIAESRDELSIDDKRDWNQLPLSIGKPSADLPPGIAAALVCYTESASETPVPLAKDQQRNESPPSGSESNTAWARRIGIPIDLELAPESIGIVEQDAGKEDVNYLFKFKSESKTKPPFKTVVRYRGHELNRALAVSKPGPTIVYTPTDPSTPSVRVSGDERVPTSVMFVFDCSSSMIKEDFKRETGTKAISRLDGARETLIKILNDPILRQFNGVGLRIYGHRFGEDPQTRAIRLSPYAEAQKTKALAEGKIFPPTHPGDDVELAFSVESFDRARREAMIERLGSLRAWGFTPLYLAIADAAGDPPRSKNEVKRIVAITDGFDNQGTGPSRRVTEERLKTLFRPNNPKIKLDIIGFGEEIVSATKEKRDALEQIASERGGHFYQADTAVDLLDSIYKSLNLGKFEVAKANNSSDRQIKELNDTWTENPEERAGAAQRKAIDYKVTVTGIDVDKLPSMDITLSGGEALELFLERFRERPTLKYRYYDPKFDGWLDLSTDNVKTVEVELNKLGRIVTGPGSAGEATRFWVAAPSISKWIAQEKAATFFVQIQNYDRATFSRRPAEAWIEISPLQDSDEPEGTVYRFCDLDFKDRVPVPRLVCKAVGFPYQTCKRAQIEVWFKMQPMGSDGVTTLPVKDLLQSSESFDGISIRAEVQNSSRQGDAVVEIGEHRLEGAEKFDKGRVKVEILRRAKRVEHDYEAGRHRFYFDKSTDVKDFTVRLTSVEKFKSSAIHCLLPDVQLGR